MSTLRIIGVALALAAIVAPAQSRQAKVSKEQFGPSWPLIVDNGTLECRRVTGRDEARAVIFTHSTGTYALNGTARTLAARNGWFPVDSIWKNNPAIPGTKLSLGALIEPALKFCE